jgi:predicted nucleic acid-binding protein
MGKKKIVLVDTDIFIKVFRGDAKHKSNLDKLEGRIGISIISVLELFQGANTLKKKYELDKQLKAYHVVNVDNQISETSFILCKKYLPKKNIFPPDCLIAATALSYKLELYTDNKSDFNFIDGIKFYKN